MAEAPDGIDFEATRLDHRFSYAKRALRNKLHRQIRVAAIESGELRGYRVIDGGEGQPQLTQRLCKECGTPTQRRPNNLSAFQQFCGWPCRIKWKSRKRGEPPPE